MLFRKTEEKADKFWQNFEEKTGERILVHSLGQYISGWDEFDRRKWKDLWGLVIVTSAGIRFHHFPQRSLFDSLTSLTGNELSREKTFFIPKENYVSVTLIKETKWWKKIYKNAHPRMIIRYLGGEENEGQLLMELPFETDEFYSKFLDITCLWK